MPLPKQQDLQKWLFRVASNPQYGGGHLTRTLQLATAMQTQAHITFLLDKDTGGWDAFLKKAGFVTYQNFKDIGTDYNALWVDHYAPDIKLLRMLKIPIAGITDMNDFGENFDLCVSYTPHTYATLCGFEYALIDPQYTQILRKPSDHLRYTLCFGQTDSKQATLKILEYLDHYPQVLDLTIICGGNNTRKDTLEKYCQDSKHKTSLFIAPPDLKDIFAQTDILLTSGGVSVLEACAAKIACVVITTADNQHKQAQTLAEQEAILYLGNIEDLTQDSVLKTIETFRPSSICSNHLIDGKGADRLGKALLSWSRNARD